MVLITQTRFLSAFGRYINRNYTISSLTSLINRKSSTSSKENSDISTSNERAEFEPVYRFPIINGLSLINRLKIYQSAASIIAIPGSFILTQMHIIPPDSFPVATVLGITGCMLLYSLGYFTTNFIGIVYLHKTKDLVKLSYINFWGRRKDEIIKINDIIPLTDLPIHFTDRIYLKFSRYSTKETLKLNVIKGMILDKAKFNRIFVKDV